MRTIVLATLLGLVGLAPHHALAQHAAKSEARIGQVQPTVIGVQQAQAASGYLSEAEIQLDKEIQRAEKELRKKLIICRGC